jgi:16S rRNA (guanine1207-N2)-methyltransferase
MFPPAAGRRPPRAEGPAGGPGPPGSVPAVDESAGEHYFSGRLADRPASDAERELVEVRLRGREVEVETAAGVFSGGRVDLGTRVLLREAPVPPASGDLLDLGCGWGALALAMAADAPGATVWAVDVSARARDLTRRNAERLGLPGVRAVAPDEVPDDVVLAALWSNPPIRVGKEALHGLLRRWLPRLAPGADAHLVVQRNLGADSLQAWASASLGDVVRVERAGSAKGYRVLRATRLG